MATKTEQVNKTVNLKTSEIFGLAPMEGVSDFPFRLWMTQTSAPTHMSTPFLRATDSFPKAIPQDFAPELSRYHLPYSIIPQVMASRPEDFVRAARLLLDAGAQCVDLNCGCPSPNPVSGGAGSSLLKSLDIFLNFVRALADALPPRSFSLKIRTGFDDASLFASFLHGLKDVPLRQLTVHGRTRKDRYDGEARWDLITLAAEELSCPVVASGDIVSHKSWLQKKAQYPDIKHVIIGRGALRNPWLFEELRTESPVALDPEILILALAAFGQIMELSYHQPERLHALVADGVFNGSCGSDLSRWQALWQALGGEDPEQLCVERFAFGRTKMIWNSMRSSLPERFFEPTLLRAKSIGAFLGDIRRLLPASGDLPLQHSPKLDWLYSSSRTKPLDAAEAIGIKLDVGERSVEN